MKWIGIGIGEGSRGIQWLRGKKNPQEKSVMVRYRSSFRHWRNQEV